MSPYVHCAPLTHLLAMAITPASEQERAQVSELAAQVQAATGQNVELAYVNQGYTGQSAAEAAAAHGIQLEVVKLFSAKRGFVLLPRPLGGRTLLRVVDALPAAFARLRTPFHDARRAALAGFCSATCSGSTHKINDRL